MVTAQLKDIDCSADRSLFINCGGSTVPFDGNTYEEDSSEGGPAAFSFESESWGHRSSGTFMDNSSALFVAKNDFALDVKGVYETARLAPQSLKYYALCLPNGKYKVQLHFAEIMYSNDQTYSSLGRRIFDISIQGILFEKNFNIMKKAGGVGIPTIMNFNDIDVKGSTLEIHLYWAGKGTNEIPFRGVYGPLISAITVTPNLKRGGLSVGVVISIVAASCVLAALILLFLRTKGYFGGKDLVDEELRGLELQTGYFTLRQIKHATNNFDSANKIGGFGPVYKGVLSDGAVIAVKQLSSKSRQGNREFVNEIGMISALQHPHLVKLYGGCIEGNQLLLVYEYLENNSLARALFGNKEPQIKLDWQTRKKILLGIAKGLAYLHEESRLKIVHRDIKATNVLLDKDLNAKISDFGLAKLDEEENSHISTRIAGTIVSEAYVLHERNSLLELVDPSIGSSYSREEAMMMLNLALLCTNLSPTLRPSMSSVVRMLEGKIPVQAPTINRGSLSQEARFKAFDLLSQDSQTHVSTFSQSSHVHRSISKDGSWIASSSSFQIKDETKESTQKSTQKWC
ncbi:unnamed protein product [Dovyalis caffra]|uniref:non-specific serine/threonine protein kinase n=1 Tax=Dovyalis caffra TaxID=77055 RepID=A0AAV1SMT7_9ROSI|nr:unnamed protein product [Dovyalis caffra]